LAAGDGSIDFMTMVMSHATLQPIATGSRRGPPEVLEQICAGQPTGDARRDALVRFVRNLVETIGTISDEEVSAIEAAGYTDQPLVDISLAIDVPAVASTAAHGWARPGKA
jgi:hypothetical protein